MVGGAVINQERREIVTKIRYLLEVAMSGVFLPQDALFRRQSFHPSPTSTPVSLKPNRFTPLSEVNPGMKRLIRSF